MEKQSERQIQTVVAQKWEGPLPSPNDLIKYNDAVPDAAQRIIQMAEEEQKHRHQREDKILKANIRMAYVSSVFGFASVFALVGLACYALSLGSVTAVIGTIIGAIASLAGLFVYQKSKSSKERQ